MTDTATQQQNPWIRAFHPRSTPTTRLVCLPHAGGSASFFFALSAAMPPTVEVLAVQYPGRQDRRHEPHLDSIEALADGVASALGERPSAPTVLFGHSMGAIVAFEVARRLQRAPGEQLEHLIVSARRAPSVVRAENLHLQEDTALVATLRELSGTDTRLLDDEEMLALVLPSVRNDYRAVETYRGPEDASVSCPISAFIGDADPTTDPEEAAGWRRHTTAAFALTRFRGSHFYLSETPAEFTAVLVGRLA